MTNQKSAFSIRHQAPSIQDFIRLRKIVGWGDLNADLARESLINSLFHVSIYDQENLIGVGRVIGDGHMYFYIQDLIVKPEYQGKGVGSMVMTEIESYLDKTVKAGATVGLLAAKGKEGFYRAYGYKERTGNPLGLGMCKFI